MHNKELGPRKFKALCIKHSRGGRETSENQTIAVVDVEQHTAAFPGHSRVLNRIFLKAILRHFLFCLSSCCYDSEEKTIEQRYNRRIENLYGIWN